MINRKLILLLFFSLAVVLINQQSLAFHDGEGEIGVGGNGQPNNQALSAMGITPCFNGMAGTFPCHNIDLAAFLPLSNIGGGTGNDIWGWTDPLTGKEYALMGRSTGTSFVDISNPYNPIYLGNLPAHNGLNSTWRGIKVYANHAFIVSEAAGHGMQVFDLTQLLNVSSPPQTFEETAHYNGFGRAHTIAINEKTGFAYAAGSRDTCSGGLHMLNIQNPAAPVFAGCVDGDGYVHETECAVYYGPDPAYQGHEICFNSNEDTLTIVDVTDKSMPVQLSRTGYVGSGYTHQGWLNEDQSVFLLDDELDEIDFGNKTRTFIWDVSDLDAPSVKSIYDGSTTSIDHNQYVRGRYTYQSNYRSGLHILDVRSAASGNLNEMAFFDVYPIDDQPKFNGTWSNYPFFASGTVIVSGIEQGLFVLRPNLPYRSLIDDASFFVAQQYRDFLNREPDPSGLGYWTSQLTSCGSDEACIRQQRIKISAAFFIEQEFQDTGYFVYRFYRASYGRKPGYQEFRDDRNKVVGGSNLEAQRDAFAAEWVSRATFQQAYPQTMTPEEFVGKLMDTANLMPYTAERQQLASDMRAGKTRARVLRDVIELAEFKTREYNPAFVDMQYFGYLKRDAEQGGFAFWLDVLNNRVPNNYLAMVCAFLTSEEYQRRFGSIVSYTNADCAGVEQ